MRRTKKMVAAAFASLAAAASFVAIVGRPLAMTDSETVRILAPQTATVERSLGDVRILRSADRRELPLAPLRVGDSLQTGPTGRVAMRLAAGPSLRVDVDSSVRFASDERIVLERGAVYLDRDPSLSRGRPTSVETFLGTVRHLGTQFEVRIEEGGLRLRVREGAATLDLVDSALSVEAGIELIVDRQGETREENVPPYDSIWGWTHEIAPTFELEGETLEAFLGWTERETGWSLRLDDDLRQSASEVVLHGAIDGMSPEEAVRAVLPTCQVSFRIDDGWLVVARL